MQIRITIVCALTIAALTLAGCGLLTHPQQRRPETTRNLALLSTWGDEYGVKILSVDGVEVSEGRQVGRQPIDLPPGMNNSLGIWLTPGSHWLEVQYVRNIETGISFTRGQVPFTVAAGHTYMVRPTLAPDRGTISFSVISYGMSFPRDCLPRSIHLAKQPNSMGQRPAFKREEIQTCRTSMPS